MCASVVFPSPGAPCSNKIFFSGLPKVSALAAGFVCALVVDFCGACEDDGLVALAVELCLSKRTLAASQAFTHFSTSKLQLYKARQIHSLLNPDNSATYVHGEKFSKTLRTILVNPQSNLILQLKRINSLTPIQEPVSLLMFFGSNLLKKQKTRLLRRVIWFKVTLFSTRSRI